MPVVVDIDVMMARRKTSVGELADRIGITPTNLAVLKNGRAKAVRFTTLDALCAVLECQPGDPDPQYIAKVLDAQAQQLVAAALRQALLELPALADHLVRHDAGVKARRLLCRLSQLARLDQTLISWQAQP